jgi:hypothetical protein
VITPAEVQQALTSAGTDDWDDSGDQDGTKEPLLNVTTF